ncbi:MAG: flagellar protein FlaG [Paenibacillaceae bacterium]
MSSNELTISQSYSPPSIERMSASEIYVQSKPQSSPAPSPSIASVRNPMKSFGELKRAEQQGELVPISDEQLVKAIQKAIKAAEGITTSLEFSVHKETHQISVKVLDKETGEIIREIPPEKNLDFLATLWRKAGILIDEKR